MIKIKKGKIEMSFPNEDLGGIQETSDGMYLKFREGSELFLRNISVGMNQIKAIPLMIMNSKAPNVTIDLNNSVSPISLS